MTEPETADYRDTVFLPKTDFPMRGSLPQKEPELLARWKDLDIYGRLRGLAKGRETFILHDGPPYANGNIHFGHALNKILKDVVTRSYQMRGFDAPYVPGWDCHGLPIEWKIEEQYRAKGQDKNEVPTLQFRAECRAFAEKWKAIQSEEFQRLGILGDWQHPYTTMTKKAETQILKEIYKFLDNGLLYRGVKPVMWSVVEKTALAEAEIEYQDHKSTTLWVRFPITSSSNSVLSGASIVIWTTTPWTIPGNRAIAFGAFDYALLTVTSALEGSLAKPGDRLIVASDLVGSFKSAAKIEADIAATITSADLTGTVASHPFRGAPQYEGYYDYDVPLYQGDFVTTEAGTGFVHIAPGHGEDDFNLGQKFKIAFDPTVGADGKYLANVKGFAGLYVYKPDGKVGEANGAVIKALIEAGALLAKLNITHSYPHSWRSKAPLIFRTTPQWFIAMDKPSRGDGRTLRQKALSAISETAWYPSAGENRIRGMIESRPDWCISRQRAWGVPIAFFVEKKTGIVLEDKAVLERIIASFEAHGADAWYKEKPEHFLGADYDPDEFEQIFDIVDVWFESGSTHAFCLNQDLGASEWPNLSWPADLYLEGSDQHRGWFHSSLLESCGTMGRAPYAKVLTHGFTLDEQGHKMSKSLGNIKAPQEVTDQMGADIMRLWVIASDYTQDQRIGPEILKQMGDLYRRFRNTLRYLLGSLDGFQREESVTLEAIPELDRWILHRLHELDRIMRDAVAQFDFNRLLTELHNFCTTDLSAFYFDIRKDSLYCDRADAPRRRATRTVMNEVFEHLTLWLAPILCFTAEEAYLARLPEKNTSIHLKSFPTVPPEWANEALADKWQKIRDARRVITGALEVARNDKKIGSSLNAHPTVYLADEATSLPDDIDLPELCIASAVTVTRAALPAGSFTLPDVAGIGVTVAVAEGEKCERCWQILPEVGSHNDHPHLCNRCHDAVIQLKKAA